MSMDVRLSSVPFWQSASMRRSASGVADTRIYVEKALFRSMLLCPKSQAKFLTHQNQKVIKNSFQIT